MSQSHSSLHVVHSSPSSASGTGSGSGTAASSSGASNYSAAAGATIAVPIRDIDTDAPDGTIETSTTNTSHDAVWRAIAARLAQETGTTMGTVLATAREGHSLEFAPRTIGAGVTLEGHGDHLIVDFAVPTALVESGAPVDQILAAPDFPASATWDQIQQNLVQVLATNENENEKNDESDEGKDSEESGYQSEENKALPRLTALNLHVHTTGLQLTEQPTWQIFFVERARNGAMTGSRSVASFRSESPVPWRRRIRSPPFRHSITLPRISMAQRIPPPSLPPSPRDTYSQLARSIASWEDHATRVLDIPHDDHSAKTVHNI